ncbi:MAG TPA: SDR family oxidoreductase [Polyangiaceae bacterium]|nr:SDR family oxidoreductase [Polyangiaceae bacterium]
MNSRLTIPSPEARIIDVVAKATRYPKELLGLDADLEDELGIDSVKLQEILVALEQAFPGVPALPERERPRTLRDFVSWIQKTQPASADPSAPSSDPPLVAPEFAATSAGAAPEASARHSLAGKIILVSGSGHGLGRATALELARRGATVVLNSFHHRELGDEVARTIGAQGGQAHHIWASMARPDHVDRLFDELGDRFGGLDVFIHNASNGVFAKLGEVTEEQWLKSFRTNVMGFHRGALRAAALMRKRGGGKILTLSSVYENATVDYFGVQGPVKAALESLTRFLAKELLNDNIQVNCLSFGALEGKTMSLYPEAERIRRATEARSQGQRRMTELEAARAQLLFLSPDADSITGSTLRIDRGMMLSW